MKPLNPNGSDAPFRNIPARVRGFKRTVLPKSRGRLARWGNPDKVSAESLPSDVKPNDAESATANRSSSGRGDSLQLYLREIGQVKLLTAEEEIALARRIKRGDRQAREHMIKANLRLVVKIARDYEGMGVPLLDLINEGNIGLMKGVERFDPKKGAKLSTYASLWIKQQIRRALANQSKTIRLPVHVVDRMAHMRRAEMKLHEALDREPTDEEIAHELDLDPRRIRQYRQAAKTPVSLDAPIGDDDSNQVSEIIAFWPRFRNGSGRSSPCDSGFRMARKEPWKKSANTFASRVNASGRFRKSR